MKAERTRRNVSQEELAETLDVSVDMVKRIENGQGARLDVACLAALTFGVSLDALLPARENDCESIINEIQFRLNELRKRK